MHALFSIRSYALAALLASGGMLLGALAFQYIGGLEPCRLCLFQRLPHVVIVLGAVDLLLLGKLRWMALLVGLALVIFYSISASLGGYHVGVEQSWWDSAVTCDTGRNLDNIDDLLSMDPVRCDAVPWSLFGISMAGYNALISAGMALWGLLVWLGLIFRRQA